MLGDITSVWCSKRDPKQTEPARPSLLCFVHPVKTHEHSAKLHNTLAVIGLEWLVVPFVFVCDLGAQADLQLADQEERSDECDHLCF